MVYCQDFGEDTNVNVLLLICVFYSLISDGNGKCLLLLFCVVAVIYRFKLKRFFFFTFTSAMFLGQFVFVEPPMCEFVVSLSSFFVLSIKFSFISSFPAVFCVQCGWPGLIHPHPIPLPAGHRLPSLLCLPPPPHPWRMVQNCLLAQVGLLSLWVKGRASIK